MKYHWPDGFDIREANQGRDFRGFDVEADPIKKSTERPALQPSDVPRLGHAAKLLMLQATIFFAFSF